jgi:hypothetical protein
VDLDNASIKEALESITKGDAAKVRPLLGVVVVVVVVPPVHTFVLVAV